MLNLNPNNLTMTRIHGAALITSLVILLVLTVIGISAMQNSSLQENIVGNLRDHDLALQAAESALAAAENNLSLSSVTTIPMPSTNKITVGTTTYGPILNRTDITSFVGSAYDTSGTWVGTNMTTYPLALDGLNAPPSYIIQLEQAKIDDLDPESRAKGRGRYYYRITARGVGSSANSAILLQETYAIRGN